MRLFSHWSNVAYYFLPFFNIFLNKQIFIIRIKLIFQKVGEVRRGDSRGERGGGEGGERGDNVF